MKGLKSIIKKRAKTVKFADEERKKDCRSEVCHNLIHQAINKQNKAEYDYGIGLYLARVMDNIRDKTIKQGYSFVQQYNLKRGLKKFGN